MNKCTHTIAATQITQGSRRLSAHIITRVQNSFPAHFAAGETWDLSKALSHNY